MYFHVIWPFSFCTSRQPIRFENRKCIQARLCILVYRISIPGTLDSWDICNSNQKANSSFMTVMRKIDVSSAKNRLADISIVSQRRQRDDYMLEIAAEKSS